MGFLSRGKQSTRTYPAGPGSVTGSAGRFRRSKTSGAREAGAAAEAWEERDRQKYRTGSGWFRGSNGRT